MSVRVSYQELQKKLVKVPVEGGQNVILCDFCLSRILEAQQQGGDLTMTILYQWAKECGDIPQLLRLFKEGLYESMPPSPVSKSTTSQDKNHKCTFP